MNLDYALLKRSNPISAYLKRNGIPVIHLKFSCVIPGHTDRNPSASIFDDDERWRCHGCDTGGDIIDLVMHHRGMDHGEAVRHLGGETWDGEPKPKPPKGSKPQLVRDYGPPPEEHAKLAPPKIQVLSKKLRAYPKQVDHLYPYRDKDGVLQAYVARVDHDEDKGGKDIFPLRWHLVHQAWMMAGYQKGERRPLMNEDQIQARPNDQVLVVEGEKCVVVASALFPDMVVCTWIGGKGQVQDADFSALKGRHVTLWRDADDEGIACMDIAARKAQANVLMTVPVPKDWPPGFDVADVAAVAPGEAQAALTSRKPYKFDISPKGRPGAWAKVEEGGWLPDHIRPIPGPMGQVKTTSASNAYIALLHHPMFATLGWDLLQKKIVWNGQELSSGKLHFLHLHLNELCGLEINQGFETVVESVACERPFNRLADQIRQTAWDKIKRVERLYTYFGVSRSDWAVAGFQRWFLGHVARILKPGTKQDLILILEGPQGQGKSTALETLGQAFGYGGYARLGSLGGGRMNDNDMMMIAGQTLIELGEMTAHRKADLDHFKDITTRNSDKYRAPYSKDTMTVPRTASFAGTTNLNQDYLSDPTGARRFVPMFCEHAIDPDGLQRDREMLYAEAYHLIEKGEPTWFTEAEEDLQAVEVEKRQAVSYVHTLLEDIVDTIDADFIPISRAWDVLGIPENAFRERKLAFEDIKRAMLELGWTYQRQTVEDDGSMRRLKGFARQATKRGRRWNKVRLEPPG